MLCQLSYPPEIPDPVSDETTNAIPDLLFASRHPWAHLGLNQGPTGYEPAALTPELWAQAIQVHLGWGTVANRPGIVKTGDATKTNRISAAPGGPRSP